MADRVVHPWHEDGEIELRGEAFTTIPIALLQDRTISDGACTLFAYLVWRQGLSRTELPSLPRLSATLHRSVRTIQRLIAELESRGWVTVEGNEAQLHIPPIDRAQQGGAL